MPGSVTPSTLAASRYSDGKVSRYCLIWNTPNADTMNGMIIPLYVFIISIPDTTIYSGIMIASNGIIIVDMIARNMKWRPLKRNFAKPYPQRDARMTVVALSVIATISEFRRLRKNIGLSLFPMIALWKFVKNVLSADVKYSRDGIHENGIARICLASMNEATIMNTIGVTVKSRTAIRSTHTSTSTMVTLPTNLFIPPSSQYSTSSLERVSLSWMYVKISMMRKSTIDIALALPRRPFLMPVK